MWIRTAADVDARGKPSSWSPQERNIYFVLQHFLPVLKDENPTNLDLLGYCKMVSTRVQSTRFVRVEVALKRSEREGPTLALLSLSARVNKQPRGKQEQEEGCKQVQKWLANPIIRWQALRGLENSGCDAGALGTPPLNAISLECLSHWFYFDLSANNTSLTSSEERLSELRWWWYFFLLLSQELRTIYPHLLLFMLFKM